MSYSSKTRVLHLNNVADTGRNLVSYARSTGRAWALRLIPHGSLASPGQWIARGNDLVDWHMNTIRPDVLDIHYAPNGYYGWGCKEPYVLHVHGSDLRVDLHKPGIGILARQSIERADAVVAATPDLLPRLKEVRKDAVYIPNALPVELLHRTPVQPVQGRVVFNARWDHSKGGLKMVEAARALVKSGVDVHGVDWGILAPAARDAGVILAPRMSKKDYQLFISMGHVVVGQFLVDALSISDLETLALGRPLVARYPGSDAPVEICEVEEIAERVLELMPVAENPAAEQKRRQWVLEHHHPEVTTAMLEALYATIY